MGWHSFQSSINIIGFYWQSINISWVDTLCPIRECAIGSFMLFSRNFRQQQDTGFWRGFFFDARFLIIILFFWIILFKNLSHLDVSKAVKILRGFSTWTLAVINANFLVYSQQNCY
jgi:hypothetical protein